MAKDISLKLKVDAAEGTAQIQEFTGASERSMRRFMAAIEANNRIMKEQNRLIRESSGAASEGPKEAAKHMEKLGSMTAQARRELLVLAHEASQGSWKRFSGSLMVLGEQMDVMHSVMSATGAAVGVAATALGGYIALLVQGSQQQSEFNKSLVLTNNFAGMTSGKMDQMAATVAKASHGTVGGARGALQELVSSGAFGPANLAAAGEAVTRLASLTDEETAKIVADFAGMQSGVAKWAAEHNKAMHFISAAQYESIRSMEEAGNAEGAQRVVLSALNEQLRQSDQNLGLFAKAWHELKAAVSAATDAVAGFGRGANVDSEIARIQDRLRVARSDAKVWGDQSRNGGGLIDRLMSDRAQSSIKDLEDALAALQRSKKLGDDVAAAQAASGKRQQDGIEASDRVRRITEEVDKRSELTRRIEEYTAAVEKMRAANDPKAPSKAEEAETVSRLRDKYRNDDQRKLETELQNLLKTYSEETVKLNEQTANYQKFGKSIDDTRLSVLRFREAHDPILKGATRAQLAPLELAAGNADRAAEDKRRSEVIASVNASVQAYREQATALQLSEREGFIASKVTTLVGDAAKVAAFHLEEQAKAVRELAAAEFDRDRNAKADKQAQERVNEVEKFINKLNAQTESIGKGTLALYIATEQSKLFSEAQADAAKYPERAASIWSKYSEEVERVTGSIARHYDISRSPGAGAKTSITRWIEDATNGAKNMERLVGGSLDRLTDSIVNFAKTGKLSFSSLWAYMAEEYIRQMTKLAVSSVLPGGGGGGGFADLFKVASSFFSSSASSIASFFGLEQKASGGGANAGSPILVGEYGPEIFTPGASGAITPNGQFGGGTVVHLDLSGQTLIVGQGVSRAEVASALNVNNQNLIAHVQRLGRQGKLATS